MIIFHLQQQDECLALSGLAEHWCQHPISTICCICWLWCFDSARFSVIFVTNHRTQFLQPTTTTRQLTPVTSIPSSKLIRPRLQTYPTVLDFIRKCQDLLFNSDGGWLIGFNVVPYWTPSFSQGLNSATNELFKLRIVLLVAEMIQIHIKFIQQFSNIFICYYILLRCFGPRWCCQYPGCCVQIVFVAQLKISGVNLMRNVRRLKCSAHCWHGLPGCLASHWTQH